MNHFFRFILLFFVITMSISCASNPEEHPSEKPVNTSDVSPKQPEETFTETEKTEEIQEFGRISKIEDSGYPNFIITVDFPERQFNEDYMFNVENSDINHAQLNALKGKYATIFYTSILKKELADIQLNGNSLLGEYAPESVEEFQKIEGTLGNAENVTTSDLPGFISLITEDGNIYKFDMYITQEVAQANGEEVLVYFYEKGVQTIHRMKTAD